MATSSDDPAQRMRHGRPRLHVERAANDLGPPYAAARRVHPGRSLSRPAVAALIPSSRFPGPPPIGQANRTRMSPNGPKSETATVSGPGTGSTPVQDPVVTNWPAVMPRPRPERWLASQRTASTG